MTRDVFGQSSLCNARALPRTTIALIFCAIIASFIFSRSVSAFYPSNSTSGLHPHVARHDSGRSPPCGPKPASNLSSERPRLAVFLLLDPATPNLGVICSFVDSYSIQTYDVFILFEKWTPEVEAMRNLSAGGRSLRVVDVSAYFQPQLSRNITIKSCANSLGYHLMCRFMSGPVYWLPEFDAYEQVLRLDDDSSFPRPITQSLMLSVTEAYAYTVRNGDHVQCQLGFPQLLRAKYEGTREVVRWGATAWSAPWVRDGSNLVFNCNFEVASLTLFRSAHYRAYWAHIEESGLFMTTRLGDHQVKTLYMETFEPIEHLVCYQDLPYDHPGGNLGCPGFGNVRSFGRGLE